jgi:hypothetical protein
MRHFAPMDESTYQSIIDELKHNKETCVLIETVIYDADREKGRVGFLARMLRGVIEATYERALRDFRHHRP